MPVTVNLDALLTPEFQNSSVTDLVNAPTTALAGISPEQAQGLELAFGIATVGDLADNTFVRAAIAIREMAKVAQ